MTELRDKRVLVLGLGDTGLSALRWLHSQSARLSVADTRSSPPGLEQVRSEMPGVAVHLGPFTSSVFQNQDLVVASPGVPLAEPEIQAALLRGTPVVGDVELFAQHRPPSAKLIAITGSNGKSTVTTLVGEMCKQAGLNTVVAGNIGLPVLDTLALPAPDVVVLELSSFQLETTQHLNADTATVLNLSEDHLDRYPGMAAYAAAKQRIFQGRPVQVLNRDDNKSLKMAQPELEQILFGEGEPKASSQYGLLLREGEHWLARGNTPLLKVSDMRIKGKHNAVNALSALALCQATGIDEAAAIDALRNFKGLPHRVEWVADINGVAYLDDSKGTNVGATCAAIAGLPQKVVLIAGGDGKGQDFSPLRQPVMSNGRAVILIGRDAPLLRTAIGTGPVPVMDATTLEAAVEKAAETARPGDAVLLSPACASFDMFRNYAHRAEVFVSAVKALAKRKEAA